MGCYLNTCKTYCTNILGFTIFFLTIKSASQNMTSEYNYTIKYGFQNKNLLTRIKPIYKDVLQFHKFYIAVAVNRMILSLVSSFSSFTQMSQGKTQNDALGFEFHWIRYCQFLNLASSCCCSRGLGSAMAVLKCCLHCFSLGWGYN